MGRPSNKVISSNSTQLPTNKFWVWLLIPILAIVLYGNTITHDYTQDDAIVIYDNMYTTDGVSGISGILSYDTFRGFFKTEGKAKLVSGGRYRPLTPIMFAIEYELFGRNPMIGHLLNILFYALLGTILYFTLLRMLKPKLSESLAMWISLAACLLYVSHPIHTEAVANIKGRDEIIAMLCSISSIWLGLRYLSTPHVKWLLGSTVLFFLGLMSKENTITFLAVWPLSVFLFQKELWRRAIRPWIAMIIATLAFLAIRTAILGFDMGGTPMELMNNPFLKIDGGQYVPFSISEKFATITYTLGKYIQLLVIPHPLTHDYYPRYISMKTFSDLAVITSLLTYIVLAVIAFRSIVKKPILAWGILYFMITLSIVSNVVFPIGTNMSERFLFMPSLGYTIILAYFLFTWLYKKTSLSVVVGLLGIVCLLYSIKTITRNTVWQSDYSLFTTDVKTSTNSAKVLNAAGGALTTEAYKEKDLTKRSAMLNQAIEYLKKALDVHPGYKNAALIMGNAHYYLGEYDAAIKAYERALSIAPGYAEAERNLAITLRDAGQYAGEKEQDMDKSVKHLRQSYSLRPDDVETIRLLGIAYGIAGNHTEAIKYFSLVVEMNPTEEAYNNLGLAYGNAGQQQLSEEMFAKAKALKQ